MCSKGTGVLVLGHGSRYAQGLEVITETAARYQAAHPALVVRPAFVEIASPRLEEALEQMVRDGKLWISRGASVAVFPEGTRSKDGEIHRFKAGAFTLAREAGVEILPVVLDGTKTLIRKNAMFNWGNRITIRVLPPVPAAKVVSTETHVLMEEVHDAMSAALAQIRNRK